MITNIVINVDDQKLSLVDSPLVASGGINEDKVKFVFDNTWNGLEKTAVFYNNADEKYEVELNDDDEAIIPAFVTVKAGILNICIYGKDDDTVKTSNIVRYRIKQGATTENENPLQPIIDEAYSEGYEKGKIEGGKYMKSFIDLCEQIEGYGFSGDALMGLWNLGTAQHYITLPYMDTRNSEVSLSWSQGVNFGRYVKEFGCDISKMRSISTGFFNRSKNVLEKLIITGFKTNTFWSNYDSAISGLTIMEEFYCDDIAFLPECTSVNLQNFFSDCSSLTTIGGFNRDTKQYDDTLGFIDFTNVTNVKNMFRNCGRLQNVKFKPNTLNINLTMSDCSMLTKESVLSVINVLNGFTATQNPTIYLSANIKNSMAHDWFCEDNDGDDIFNECVPGYEGAMTFSEAVIAKGWNLQ